LTRRGKVEKTENELSADDLQLLKSLRVHQQRQQAVKVQEQRRNSDLPTVFEKGSTRARRRSVTDVLKRSIAEMPMLPHFKLTGSPPAQLPPPSARQRRASFSHMPRDTSAIVPGQPFQPKRGSKAEDVDAHYGHGHSAARRADGEVGSAAKHDDAMATIDVATIPQKSKQSAAGQQFFGASEADIASLFASKMSTESPDPSQNAGYMWLLNTPPPPEFGGLREEKSCVF